MLPDGTFGILVSQMTKLFPNSIPQNNSTREVKSLLGMKKPLLKIRVIRADSDNAYHARALNFLTLVQFETALVELVANGSIEAKNFNKAMVGLSLTQLWSDAFGIKFEKEERTKYVASRQEHLEQFHTRLTPFWQADGCVGKDYQKRVIEFKICSSLPPYKSVNNYTETELRILNIQEVKYQTLREVGLGHEEALNKIRI